MKARVDSARSTLNQHVRLSLALVGLALAVLVMFVPGSHALTAATPFELEGNVTTDHAGPGIPDDWDRVFANSGGSWIARTFIGASQEAAANDTTYFIGGGSKDIYDIPSWNWTAHSAPDKDEITDAMAAAYVNPGDGHTIVYFGADRYAVNGDSNIGFWFTQNAIGLNSDGTFSGTHTNGDMFVLSAFGNGGSSPTITVYDWQNGNLNLLSTGSPCVSSGIACAFVNTSATPMPVPWPYTPKSGSPGAVPQNGFFEGGIDLNSLFSANNLPAPCFSSFLAETRSSTSLDSELKDLALGSVNSCATIELKKTWSGKAGSTTLNIGGTAGGSDVASTPVAGADGTTGAKTVGAGTYYVSEAPAPTNYTTTLACENDKNGGSTPVTPGANNSIALVAGDQVVCTFTNTYVKAQPSVSTTLSASSIAVGGTIHDSATLAGFRAPATGGTVTYKVFDNNTCATNANTIAAGTKNVTSGIVPDSDPITFNNAGDYYWQASFSGDADNNAATSVCTSEHLVVNKAQPSIATTLSASSITAGGSVHDSSALTGATAGAGGTVAYKVYDNNTCATNANTVDAGTKTVTAHIVPDSDSVTFNNAGDYYWQASYSGDANNQAATSACLSEHLVVNKAQPSIATTLSASSITAGGSVHDSSTLTGAAAGAGGTVAYKVYDNNTCATNANTVDAGTKTVTAHIVPDSNPVTFNTPGDFYWQAVYSGDANNQAATSPCLSEHLVVNKAQPSIATTLSASSITVGGSVHDSSALTDATAGAGGTVAYKVYDNNTCATNANTVDAGTKTVTAHIVPDSNPVTFNIAGDYYWQASYSGDANNQSATSPCFSEHLVVNKAQPSIATTLSASSITVGGSVHDSSALTGATTTAGGTVAYKVYDNNTCATNANTVDAGTKTVTNHIVPDSSPVTFNIAGDYYWQAVYSGDTNNDAATSPCLSEHLVVNKAQPSIATTLSASSITVGGSVHDSSALTGATTTAGGTVAYKVYDNNTCATNANTVDAGTKTVTNHIVPDSSPVTFNIAGDYYWQAVYSGDTNNDAATSPCLSEHLVVNKATPSATTTLHNASGNASVDNGTHLPLGSSLYDVASLSGVQGIPFGGTATFNFFKNAACTGSAFATQSGAAITGSSAMSSTQGPLGAGSYSFNAQYLAGSDPSYTNSAVSSCEPFVIDQAQLDITTRVEDTQNNDITGSTVQLGSLVHDVAPVTGAVSGFTPSGGVSFVLYNLANCQGVAQPVSADSTKENGDVRSINVMNLVPGQYGFIATVAGDSNYLGKAGTCENFTVAQATTATTTAIHDAAGSGVVGGQVSAALGTSVYDTASVTSNNSAANPSGNVSFRFFSNGSCSGEVSQNAGTVALNGNGVASPSSTEGPLAAGSYSFQATFAGDANFVGSTSDCEPLTVSKGTPSTATTLHNASGDATVANGSHLPNGYGIYDVATLSNGSGFPFSGTVTFEFFNNSPNSELPACGGTPLQTQTGVSISGSTATSSTHSNLAAGSYAFDAKYVAGNDANHNDSPVSTCEPFTIDASVPTIATTLSASEVVLASSVHDSTKLTNVSSNAGGTVTYTVFDNNICTANANTRSGGSVTVTNGTVPDSNTLVFNTAGDFYWQAAYGGDNNNLAATSACTSEHLIIDKPAITITKTPASQTIDSGGTANFTITVTNTGTVTLTNVTVTDPLSTGCAKTIGTLTAGQSTNYTCSQASVTAGFTNVATVTGHPPVGPDVTASASAIVTVNPPSGGGGGGGGSPTVDLAIVKTADPTSLLNGGNVTYTLSVTNNGPVTDTSVQVADSLPAGVTFVSVTPSQGTCTGGALVQCTIGSMTNGQKVTIAIVVNTTTTGTIVNTATVVGALPETTLTNNTSSTTITVNAPPVPAPAPKPVFKPPVVKPKPKPKPVAPACYAVVVAPQSLTVGSNGKLHLRVTAKNKAIAGVKVEVTGPGILILSSRTDSAGRVTVTLNPKKPGIVLVKPASYKGCTNPRVGVIAAFTPPITG